MSGLTDFQAEVARLFFSLPAAGGFLLAGGGALLASGLTTCPTEDLDFFGERGRSDVVAPGEQLEAAAIARGWEVDRIQVSESFARLHVHGGADVLVHIAIDVSAGHPPVVSIDTTVLAVMMRTLDRFADEVIPTGDTSSVELRAFFAAWADDLDQRPLDHDSSSVPEEQDALERELQSTAGEHGVPQILGVPIALGEASCGVPVLLHHIECKVPSAHDQRGADEVPIDGVAHRPAPRLDLDEHSEVIVNCVDLVGHPNRTVIAEEDRLSVMAGPARWRRP